MKRTSAIAAVTRLMMPCVLLSGVVGCNPEVVGQIATLSGAYVGDIVTVAVTGCLNDVLGLADSGSVDGHSHEAEPLHDHEH